MLYRLIDGATEEVLGTYEATSATEAKEALAKAYGFETFNEVLRCAPSVGHCVEAEAAQ